MDLFCEYSSMNFLKFFYLKKRSFLSATQLLISTLIQALKPIQASRQSRANRSDVSDEDNKSYEGLCHRLKIVFCSVVLMLFFFPASALFSQYNDQYVEEGEFVRYSIQLGECTHYIQEIYGVYAFESIPPKILDDVHELDRIVYNILHEKNRISEYAQKLEEVKRREVYSITDRMLKYITDFEALEDVLQRSKSFFEAYTDARYPVENSLISRLNTQFTNIRLTKDLNAFHSRVRSLEDEIDRLLEKYRVVNSTSDAQRSKNKINYDYVKNFRYQKILPLVWVYEDLSGRKMDNPLNLVEEKTPKELFALFSKEKFPLLVDYFTSKVDRFESVEHNAFKLASDNYAYYFVIHVKMFNRDFYFDISDYDEKMHTIKVLELY